MRLILIRHAKTVENEARIIQGRNPGQLSEEGFRQATLLGQRLSKEHIDIIYSSPSGRCKKTLDHILKELVSVPPVEFKDSLQERDFGELVGLTLGEEFYDLLENETEESRKKGIEPVSKLYKRTKTLIQSLAKRHAHETVLVVTHSNNIRAALMYFRNKTFMEILDLVKIKNCAYSEFQINADGKVDQIVFDDDTHLNLI